MKQKIHPVFLLGIACALLGALINPWTVARYLCPDRQINSAPLWVCVLFFQFFFFCIAAALISFKRNPDIRNLWLVTGIFAVSLLLFLGYDFYRGFKLLQYSETPDQNINVHIPDPVLGWKPKPGSLGRHISIDAFDVYYEMDKDGFKKINNAPDPDKSIYVFGDSFTFGYGVGNQHTFAAVLAEKLLTKKVNVFNLGVMGYGILQMYLRYLTIEDRLRPGDIVLFTPITPDIDRDPETAMLHRGSFIFSSRTAVLEQYPVYSQKKIRFVKIQSLEGYWNVLTYMAPYASLFFKSVRNKFEGTNSQKSAEILEIVRRRVEAKGAHFILTFFPLADECLEGRYQFDLKSFEYWNMMPHYCPQNLKTLENYEIPADGHPSVLGHFEAAKAILKILLQSGFLDSAYLKKQS